MSKFFSLFIFMSFSFAAQAQYTDEQGYVDLGVVQEVIVQGSVLSGNLSKLKTIIPQIYAVHKTQDGSETADCTGVLIASDVVLTAAHCLAEEQSTFAVSVQLGDYTNLVSSVVRHPKFSDISFTPTGKGNQISGFHDIALIFLQRPVKGVRPVLLPPRNSRLKPQSSLLLFGFGKTSLKGPKSKKLLWTEASAMEGTRSRVIVKSKKVSCKGDSGGPALSRYGSRFVVRGVTSAGDCETYAYYTRVADYVDWILDEIAKFRTTEEI